MITDWEPLPLRRAAPVPDALPRFLAWAAQQGVGFEPIEIRMFPDGNRGAFARRAIAPGERLITVPRHAMITSVDVGRDLERAGAGGLAGSLRSRHGELALWLALQRADADSRWARYLDVLPPSYPGLAMFRPGHELAPLAGTRALIAVSDLSITCCDDYVRLREALPGLPTSLADYAWGRAVAGSRCFAIAADDGSVRALVPVVDLANHGAVDAQWGYDDATHQFEVWADRPIVAGQEIRVSYGKLDNAQLLASYGFTLADNPADEIAIELPTHDGRRAYRIGAIYDPRFQKAMAAALAWPDTSEADALRRIAAATAGAMAELTVSPMAPVGDPDWQTSCAQVRAGERKVAAAIIAFVDELVAGGCDRTPDAWLALAASIEPAATGVPALLRTYAEVAAGCRPPRHVGRDR